MNRVIIWLFSQTKFGKLLDGKKTVIGAACILLSHILTAFEVIAPMFPQEAWLQSLSVSLKGVCQQVAHLLEQVGLGAIGVGLVHKAAKSKA